MGFHEDAELTNDKQRVRNLINRFNEVVVQSNDYIDKIVNKRYGDLNTNVSLINTLKASLEEIKLKYPEITAEVDDRIAVVDANIATIMTRWNTEVYDKLNG